MLVLIDFVGGQLQDFNEQTHLLLMTTLKIDEDEIKQLKLQQQNLEEKLRKTEKEAKEIDENLSTARVDLELALITNHALAEREQGLLSKWSEGSEAMKKSLDEQKKGIDQVKEDIQELTGRYQPKLVDEQERWLSNLLDCLGRISHRIQPFVCKFTVTSAPGKPTLNDLLTIIADITRRQFLDTATSILDHS